MDKEKNIVVLIHIINAYLSEGIIQFIRNAVEKEYNVLIKYRIARDSVNMKQITILHKNAINYLFCYSTLEYRHMYLITRILNVSVKIVYSYKLQARWLRSVTRINYQSKRIGIPYHAIFLPLELFRV